MQNNATAVEWFQRAAEQGFVYAQMLLGYCYENGVGVWVDMEQMQYWYDLAAAQGLG